MATTVASFDPPEAPWLIHQGCPRIGLRPVHAGYGYRRCLPTRIRALAREHDVVIIEGICPYHAYAPVDQNRRGCNSLRPSRRHQPFVESVDPWRIGVTSIAMFFC